MSDTASQTPTLPPEPDGVDGTGDTGTGNQQFTEGYRYSPELLPSSDGLMDGMWRYRRLLPLSDGPIRYPLPVGGTPLIRAIELAASTGMSGLYLKDETRGPSGSNKDRATALVLEQALRTGVHTVSCASTGNVAISLAVGAAAAGLRAVVFVPAYTHIAKLNLMLYAGAMVFAVDGGYTAAFDMSRTTAQLLGWLDRNTGVNPDTLEAKKTVAFEIWEQLGREVPDVVLVPVGDGVTLAAMAKGFRELRACGLAATEPRLIGVQADGCQPVKSAWEGPAPTQEIVPRTIADGIAVARPVAAAAALRAVRDTGGSFVAVSDTELMAASELLAMKAGVIAEPAGAASLAGLLSARNRGLVAPDERAVVHVTGSGLKTLHLVHPTTQAHVVGAIDDVLQVFDGT